MTVFLYFFRINNSCVCVYTFCFFMHCQWTLDCNPTLDCSKLMLQISLEDPTFSSFRYIPRSGIARSCDSSIFNFFNNFHAIFHHFTMVEIQLHHFTNPPIMHTGSSFSISLPTFVFCFIVAILMGVR